MIEGHQYTSTDTNDLTVDSADSTNDRIDRVVLGLDANTDKLYIKAFIKKGETSSNPVPPDLERSHFGVGEFEVHINMHLHGAESFEKVNFIVLDKQAHKAGIIMTKEGALDVSARHPKTLSSQDIRLTG